MARGKTGQDGTLYSRSAVDPAFRSAQQSVGVRPVIETVTFPPSQPPRPTRSDSLYEWLGFALQD